MKKIYPGMLLTMVLLAVMVLDPVIVLAEQEESSQVSLISLESDSGNIGKYGMLPVYGRDVKDGTYLVEVETASSVVQVMEAQLTVKSGEMFAEIILDGNEYSYLFMGSGSEAESVDASAYIIFSENGKGQYSGTIPLEALDKKLNCAVFDRNEEKWYDDVILFEASSLPESALLVELPDYDLIEKAINALDADQGAEGSTASEENAEASKELGPVEPMNIAMDDGEYSIEVDIAGGSGKASIVSPTILTIRDGKAYAEITWSSSNYDYMIVGTEKYLNENTDGGNSQFEIPIACMDDPMPVIADTTAMGTPHEVNYTFTFYSDSIGSKSQMPQEAAKRVVVIAIIIIVGGGILNYFVNRKKR